MPGWIAIASKASVFASRLVVGAAVARAESRKARKVLENILVWLRVVFWDAILKSWNVSRL